ncbi:MAG: BREX system P-loop protein BrxC, partial [Solirubrobacteraceae bacterium]
EITLEEDGRLAGFITKYQQVFSKDWDAEKGKVALAMQQASRVMHELEPDTFTTVDSWRESVRNRADITPNLLAERCLELMKRRRPKHSLVFVIDEVGQFVARDVQKMLDLQAVVQSLGRVGRGKMWLVVTSQEKLSELVGGLDDTRVELARLMDRFPQPLQVHLEPSDISEVTSRRVLSKHAQAQKILRELFNAHRGRLTYNTRMTAAITLPELSTDAFVDLYPLLPYQIDLIINVVSGLRTAGGASRHVGGANRTIIKLAQQLLIHPDVNLADAAIGDLARIDQVYDLVSGNVPSELRGKIETIKAGVDHPLAQSVAKAICLLQYVQSIHRTPENVAATLQASVQAHSRLPEVKAALDELEKALMVRQGDDGYRIPSPAEDDWEKLRASARPKAGDVGRAHADAIRSLWQPQPSHNLNDVKAFKAGLYLNGRPIVQGDIDVYVTLVEPDEAQQAISDARERSRGETASVFWIAVSDDAIERETAEVFRSREVLSRKERGAQTKDETALVAEEKRRQRRHEDELQRLVKQALLNGSAFFRGNDRSPDESSAAVAGATEQILAVALPDVFNRFEEAAARVTKADLDALLTSENLLGLTPVFSQLHLVRDESGIAVINSDRGPLAEMFAKIADRTVYGETATGRYLTDEFAKEPFGWDVDVVRLFAAALLRAGKIQATSKGQVIDSATSLEARNTFPNNNLFRSVSFQPKPETGVGFEDLVRADSNFKDVFGRKIAELEEGTVAREIRAEVEQHEQRIREVHTSLMQYRLPGTDVLETALDQMAVIRRGAEEQVILSFNASHHELKEAIKRATELEKVLTPGAMQDLERAGEALAVLWPYLTDEPDLADTQRDDAAALKDLLAREDFFRVLPEIDQRARRLEEAYASRLTAAVQARTEAYAEAAAMLRATAGWESLTEDQRARVSATITQRAEAPSGDGVPIPLLREQTANCSQELSKAVLETLKMIEGDRIARVSAASYFAGGIDTEEQLEAALKGLREQIEGLIAAGKKVIVD